MDSRTIIRLLTQAGWQHIRTTGSHHQFRHPGRASIVTVAHPQKDVKPGTLRSIEKQSGVPLRKF